MQNAVSWNPALYQDKHAFVYAYGESLVDVLSPQEGERILDIGCGTGQLTHKIAQQGAEVLGIDSAADMVAQARSAFPDVAFKVQSALHMSFEQPFDALFSNAVFHWIDNQPLLAERLFDNLRPGGRLIAEFGGKGNNANIIGALQEQLRKQGYARNAGIPLWYFPSVGAYTSLLEAAGFRVEMAQWYERDTELKDAAHGPTDWIRMFCPSFLQHIPAATQETILAATEKTLHATNYRNGKWYADYKRIRVMATKPI